jgi:hypothetical protein
MDPTSFRLAQFKLFMSGILPPLQPPGGGMKQTNAILLAFKRQADLRGLLDPGKIIAWENPEFDFAAGENFLLPGLEARARAAQA